MGAYQIGKLLEVCPEALVVGVGITVRTSSRSLPSSGLSPKM